MRKLPVLAASLVLSLAAFSASAATPSKVPAKAHISMGQAKQIALKTMPGKIVKQELEKEQGGSGLRYSFDIRAGGVVHEIGVDAMDGKVLENSIDNGND